MMELNKIASLVEQGQISKRVCFQMMREKFLLLKECQELLRETPDCSGIHLQKDGIVYEAKGGAKLFFNFEEQPVSRAEAMLCRLEREDWGFIWSLMPGDGVVLDIGANAGWFTIQLAKRYPDTKIYAFEPVAYTYDMMIKNLELNDIGEMSSSGGQVYAVNAGLYDKDGESTIYVPSTSEASSLQPVNDEFYLREGEGQIAQPCIIKTIDTFISEQGIERLDFIKCDTEGAEKMVFAGAVRVLRELRPMVYTEMLRKHARRFGYHPNDIIAFFKELGYRCYREENRKLIPFVAMDEETVETNFFFLHGKKHAEIIIGS